MVNRMANVLKSHGVKKGDVVCIYMPVSPLAVAAMLACSRIGAPHRSITIINYCYYHFLNRITLKGRPWCL